MEVDDKKGEALKNQRFQMLQDIAEELSGEINFPTSFDVVIRLREALNDPDWSLEQVTSILSTEPLIASRLVVLANSVAYNVSGVPVNDVKTAVMRLGINLVRSTALAIATSQIRSAKSMSVFADFSQRLWEHSLRTASFAYVISKHYTSINPDEAMLAGIVHDIGGFYMLYRASQYEELRSRPDTVKYLITQWHEHIGYTLLNALGLPEAITEAVREHDEPRAVPSVPRNLPDIIYVSNLLAGGSFEWQYMDNTYDDEVIARINEKFADLIDEVDSYEGEIRSVFN
ncbi:HDOD domain-containing protein [Sedimenticola sp.]|uniref:HDOD domain-containing protein n=1 Tax=Sedimenticola sp. TaxID=1940285 RepID=UPI003D0D9081